MVFDIIEHLQIRPELKESILEFRKQYPVEPQFQSRIPVPSNIYYGTDIWEKAVTALLCGKSCRRIRKTAVGCIVSCQYGCCISDRYGYF